LDLVANQPKEREVRAILSNSFGFGGTNAALVLSPVD
jgi:3-oxoacyl-[acyl-carrier-protein] synthase II